jgi:hypothetical protein
LIVAELGLKNARLGAHILEMTESDDNWVEDLRCPQCGQTGTAAFSQADGFFVVQVVSVSDGFRTIQTEYGPNFCCSSCDCVVED